MRLSNVLVFSAGIILSTCGLANESPASKTFDKAHSATAPAGTRAYFDLLTATWRTELILPGEEKLRAGITLPRADFDLMELLMLPDGSQGVRTNGQLQMGIGAYRDPDGVEHEICLPMAAMPESLNGQITQAETP